MPLSAVQVYRLRLDLAGEQQNYFTPSPIRKGSLEYLITQTTMHCDVCLGFHCRPLLILALDTDLCCVAATWFAPLA